MATRTDRLDRHNPLGKKDYLSLQHVARYRFALRHVSIGMRVLDVACGTGYGTEILARHACHAVGGDIDAAQLSIARSDQSRTGDYVALDVLALPFCDESFDAVVSFETIEHVIEGSAFLDEMKRVLKPGGLFICSTPNIAYTSHPPYHVKEYRPDEYFALIQAKFGPSALHGQYFSQRDWMIEKLAFWKRPRLHAFLPAYFGLKILGKSMRLADRHLLAPLRALRAARFGRGVDDDIYAVTDYRGEQLLRVMVTVSAK